MGFVLILLWTVTTLLLLAAGRSFDNNILFGIGAIMVLMTAMIVDF